MNRSLSPGLDEDIAGIWQDIRDAAIAVLPRWVRRMYGYDAPPPMTPGRRTEIRHSLGVLDAMVLGQPGVLEARQRFNLRMRGTVGMKLIRLLTAAMAGAGLRCLAPGRVPAEGANPG